MQNLNQRLEGIDRVYTKKGDVMRRPKKRFKKIFLRALILFVIIGFLFYFPIRGIYQSTRNLKSDAKAFQEATKNNSLDDMRKNILGLKNEAENLDGSLNWLFWLRIIPFVGGFYSDAKHFTKALGYELSAAQTLVDSLDPYKQELGLNGVPTPGQDKIAKIILALDKLTPMLDQVEPSLKKARSEVEEIHVDKYPEKLGKYKLRSNIDLAKNFIIGVDVAITSGKDALLIAPSALGQPTPKNYLIIFQNDKEIRPTGGFMTAYAFLSLDKGKISSSTSDDIYRLDEKLLKTCLHVICPLTPPDPLVKYLPEANGKPRSAWSMRDSNLSPDVPTSMRDFEKLYSFLPDTQKFDGIILIDTHVVEELIKITGPIDVFGTTYSGDLDKRCNCPNVIYELESYAQIIEKGEEGRKAILGTLMQQILARSLGASTEKLPEFINVGIQLANGKHIMVYMHDQKVEDALSKLNWIGQIKNFDGDYLHISDANFAGGKSNLYVTQNVKLKIDTKSQNHKLTIEYDNPQKYDIWLNAINRDYIRIYVPKGSKLISSKGSEVAVATKDDEVLNKTYFEGFIQVRPLNSLTLSLEYEVPSNLKGDSLLIQKQPGAKDFEYTIFVNGKEKEKFELNSDKEIKINI